LSITVKHTANSLRKAMPPHLTGLKDLLSRSHISKEIGRETTETLLPIASLIGFVLGAIVTFEALAITRGDLAISVTYGSLLVCGPLAPPLVGLLIALRMSTTQATEIQVQIRVGDESALNRESVSMRLKWMAAAGLATCSLLQLSAAIGSILAIEWRLPGASGAATDLFLTARPAYEWLLDGILAMTISAMIGAAAIYAANAGARNDREIARTAGRSATLSMLAVIVPTALFWLIRAT